MTALQSTLSERAAELRRVFDQSFANPVQTDKRETIDFISLRLAGKSHAICITEIAGLAADVRIIPCPSPIAELRGLAGFRGTPTPVYDLAGLLGYPMSSGRWVVLTSGRALALAFDEFEDHFQVDLTAVVSQQESPATRHVGTIARHAGRAWPVINIPSVIATIKARVASVSSQGALSYVR